MPKAPATPPPLPAPATHRPGQTTPNKDGERTFKQPHERDESAGSQQRAPDPVMQQAHDDVERGLVDTSRAEATDQAYRRNLRSEPQAADGSAKKDEPGERAGKSR